MKLPKMPVPRFDITLPLSGKNVSARPFFVGEQKVILQAKEMGDKAQLNNAIDDVLKVCTFDALDIDSLEVADVEYLILQIRAKSVDELVKMSFECQNIIDNDKGEKEYCHNNIPCLVPIMDVTVQPDTRDRKIMISEHVGLMMKGLSYGDYKRASESDEMNNIILLSSIESIFDADTVYKRSDYTDEEYLDFLNNIYSKDFAKINDYVRFIPALEWETELTCKKCGNTETISFKGLDDFLE